jgi:hypothetical protein
MFKPLTSRATRQLLAPSRASYLTRRCASTATFDWKDPLGTNNNFTEDELAIAETAEAYSQEQLLPRVLGTFYCILTVQNHLLTLSKQRPTAKKITTNVFWKRWASLVFWVQQFKATAALVSPLQHQD